MAIIGSFIAANIGAIIATTVAASAAAITAGVQAQQQNAQIKYQQEVQRQNIIAAQNKAAAEARDRRIEVSRQQAAARAKMAASGVDSTSGSFLDMLGNGAAAGEMDVLKAKFDGDATAWTLNNKINELESQKQNVGLAAGLAGIEAGVGMATNVGWSGVSTGTKVAKMEKAGKVTSGNSGFAGVAAMEGTIA